MVSVGSQRGERLRLAGHAAGDAVERAPTHHHHLLELAHAVEDDERARLLHLSGEQALVEDSVDLVEVEDEVELADVAEVAVEHLDEEVDALEVGELVVARVDAEGEEEARVAAVDDLVGAELDEVGELAVAARDEAVHLVLDLALVRLLDGHVPLRQARLALPVLQQEEAHRHGARARGGGRPGRSKRRR